MAKATPQQTAPVAQAKPAVQQPAQQAQQAPAQPSTKVGAAVVLEGGERRIDYIRRRFKEGAKRGEIAKELGVAYQIVFAATKVKKEAPAAPAGGAPAAQ